MNVKKSFISVLLILLVLPVLMAGNEHTYVVVDTGQDRCFDNRKKINSPARGGAFYGQDAQYETNPPAYRDNGDGTITDLNTGLMWQKTPDFVKRSLSQSHQYAKSFKLAGYTDWRLPTIKELFSIANLRGNMRTRTPYIDTRYFDFRYPDTSKAGRDMDAQYRSSTVYKGLTMRDDRGVFGFNFADGRIKAYPTSLHGAGLQYVRCVRGKTYGKNAFTDNKDGTVTDHATGLTWMKADNGKPMTWEQALKYAENLKAGGYSNWRLPNVKELQSIVDYNRAPDALDKKARSAAIDPIFQLTQQESWFWTGTTHIETGGAYYVCFGQGFSAWLHRGKKMNAHGAGAVRSDPKSGNPALYSRGKGPQGDEVRIYNYVRCVRGGNVKEKTSGPAVIKSYQEKSSGHSAIRSYQTTRPGPGKMKSRMNGNVSHAKRFITRLDKNGDGKVSKSEFDGPAHHFTRLDKNKDGFISEKEAPKRPPPRRFNQRL